MNNDYLWDRTGEPDAEVQELEEVLGTLRYQPRPLELPADVQPAQRRRFFPALAIAATIALMVLAAGVWLRFHRQQPSLSGEMANTKPPSEIAPPKPNGPDRLVGVPDKTQTSRRLTAQRKTAPRRSIAPPNANGSDALVARVNTPAMDRAAGEAAKEQLMLALRVASAKLNHAQRKTMGLPATNNIRNQHKLG
jgi:hypothetical protein